MPKYQNLIGKQFGLWTVVSDTYNKTSDNDHLWNCKCECGIERQVRGSSLKRGLSKSCGCLKSKQLSGRSSKNIANQRFGRLVALYPTERRQNGSVVWFCQCDCGRTCEVSVHTLTRSGVHSCGCYNREQVKTLNKKDLTNQRFGKLIAIKESSQRSASGSIVWECQCDCGNICFIPTNSLTSGNTSSCGCINYSIGEKHIEEILKDNNIAFQSQYTEPSLNKKRFDFAIYKDSKIIRLIEFDGSQHYNDTQGLWNSKENLQDIQKRDQEKNEWAFSRKIPLIRIPYWERDKITLDILLGDKYLISEGT